MQEPDKKMEELKIPELKPATTGEIKKPDIVINPPAMAARTVDPRVSNDPPPNLKVKKFRIPKKVLIGVGVAFLVFLLAIIIPGISIYAKTRKVQASVNQLQESIKSQNIETVSSSLSTLKNDLTSLKGSYQILVWTKFIPFFGGYWSDGSAAINAGIYGIEAGEITIETVKPYADLIGFTGSGNQAQNGEETAKDRIDFIVKTVETISPQLDKISEKVSLAQGELSKVNPNRYPKTWAGKPV